MENLQERVFEFNTKLEETMYDVLEKQEPQILNAAHIVKRCTKRLGRIFVVGTGHSSSVAFEAFMRAGGLVNVVPLVPWFLTMIAGGVLSGILEKQKGFGKFLFRAYEFIYRISRNDCMIFISQSGCNAVTVEMAKLAQEAKVEVIVITSSQGASFDNELLRIEGVTAVDTGVPFGDTVVKIDGLDEETSIGPLSTMIGIYVWHVIMISACEMLVEDGYKKLPVIISGNTREETSERRNQKLILGYLRELLKQGLLVKI